MKYKVLLFAVLAEIAQTHQIEMEIKKEMTAKKLIQNLVELYPKMKEYEDNLIVAVDTKPTIRGIGFTFNPHSQGGKQPPLASLLLF